MRRRRSQGRVHPLMMMTAAPLSDVEAPLRLRGWPSPTYSLKARRQFLIGAAILTMFLLLIMHTNHAAAAVAMSSFIIPHHPSPSTATYRRGNVRRRACDGMLPYQWECRPCTPSMAAAQSSTSVSLTAATFNNHSNSNNNNEEEDGNDDGDDVLWTTTTTKMTGSDTSSSPIPPRTHSRSTTIDRRCCKLRPHTPWTGGDTSTHRHTTVVHDGDDGQSR